MMGTNHALSGAAAWVAVASTAPSFPALGIVQIEPLHMVTGALVCAGAALLPDADHHNATIAHSVPIAGRVAAGAVGAISGGHRHGMHSILAIVGCWFAMGWIGQITWDAPWWGSTIQLGAAVATAALLTFALKVLQVAKSWPKAWMIGILAAAAMALFLPNDMGWFQLCVTVGFTAHILGDFLTVEGINWFWPLKIRAPKAVQKIPILNKIWKGNGYMAVPILAETGSVLEYMFGATLGLYTLAGLAVNVLGVAL
ncbi:metal-dependent hydrolase [Leucobacter sp. cx-169]|uniref:metal-dependent hydrolase n=1 Tax=Leucobacter sp. cx-169 TaxID=2770549 RepID=UPI00165D670F|nr:metal-dependent hydrolase [Leucobacter sp. cx-169]MBC9927317.1 metal-dependent hydrolase [Leucobacter sp. cx-169]